MRVLIVARCKNGRYAPFIVEQVRALEKSGIECRYFGLLRKGIGGYLLQFPEFLRDIRSFHPDIVHAHYGLSGLFANLQRKVPVVTTFHGSDINDPHIRPLSKWAMRKNAFSVFVSQKNLDLARPKEDFALIPCGVDLGDYPVIDKVQAREMMDLEVGNKYVLFSGAFDNDIKNAPLAQKTVALLPGVTLLELKGYTREQVTCLMQAVDAFLMTSYSEGSPQVIKEALACGCPIVSVDVGDVRERIEEVEGCFIADGVPIELANAITKAFEYGRRTDGRRVIEQSGLTNDKIAQRLLSVYHEVLK